MAAAPTQYLTLRTVLEWRIENEQNWPHMQSKGLSNTLAAK